MPYYVTRTGLEAFDTARAWGLAVVLNVLTGDEVAVFNTEWAFVLNPLTSISQNATLSGNPSWGSLFAEAGWQQVFELLSKMVEAGRMGCHEGHGTDR